MPEPKRYRLAVVQKGNTQFDGPLFARLACHPELDLRVYYTSPATARSRLVDPELGHEPIWDHLGHPSYGSTPTRAGLAGLVVLARSIAKHSPHLVVISGYVPLRHLMLALLLRVAGVPVGLRSDTTLLHTPSRGHGLRALAKRALLSVLARTYTTAHPVGTLAAQYLAAHGFEPRRHFLFPYAVDNAWFAANSRQHKARRSELRRAEGIPDHAFVILGVLKFSQREDPFTLLRAFAELQDSQPHTHLILVGDGPLAQPIRQYIADHRLQRVHLPGYVAYSRLPFYYALSDVFVHPATCEAWGVSVNEAMACSLPVIVSDMVGSHVDLVTDADTGYTFPIGDYVALAARLQSLSSNPEGVARMASSSVQMIARWSYETTEANLLQALDYAAARRRH